MILLEGQVTANKLNHELKTSIEKLKLDHKITLAIILIGHNDASESYIRGKIKAANDVGIQTEIIRFSKEVTENEVLNKIDEINNNPFIHAMILQLPIPKHLNKDLLIDAISVHKDADGFHTYHQGLLHQSRETIFPATPLGIILLLEAYNINLDGLKAVVIGRSNIVGSPIARLLMDKGSTVTICHSKTKNLEDYTLDADLIVVAVGKPNMLQASSIKEGSIIIDVGINKIDDKLVGDVDFEEVSKKVAYITPVPKGVGPMTIHGLLRNTYTLFLNQKDE
jgi:methylenetetrahydrofolate dehydrogenase (NADP+)/methenyltetrahydrofolate cyclohydrolase